jgi:hypothetical protein
MLPSPVPGYDQRVRRPGTALFLDEDEISDQLSDVAVMDT